MDSTAYSWIGTAPRNVRQLADRVPRDRCLCHTEVKCKAQHETIIQHPHDTRRNRVPAHGTQNYGAMHLAQEAIKSFDMPATGLKRRQREAIGRLAELITREGRAQDNPLRRLGWADGGRAVPKRDMEAFLQIFNEIFFFNSVVPTFLWRNGEGEWLGICNWGEPSNGNVSQVMLDPRATNLWDECDEIKGKAISRLGTLLHEATHAYFQQYACGECGHAHVDWWMGHGRAWQLLAAKLEEKTLEFWGLPLDLSRFRAISHFWGRQTTLPCFHDLDRWNLTDDMG